MAKKPSVAKKRASLRLLIVEARFYDDIADKLLAGATAVLDEAGATYDIISVPGALEVPPAIVMALDAATAKRAPYDGVVALGCVIQGETYHFESGVERIRARPDGPRLDAASLASATASSPSTPRRRRCAPPRRRARPQGRRRRARRACHGARSSATSKGMMARPRNAPAKDKRKANRRGAARLAAVQALYQMDLAGTGLNEILAEFESHWIGREVEGAQYLPAEAAFFRDIVTGVVREQRALDPLIDEALAKSWPLKRIEAVLRAVLRAGAYELAHRKDVPARVVVSEYADVAAAFVEREETGMVNAVLDHLARRLRAGRIWRSRGVMPWPRTTKPRPKTN